MIYVGQRASLLTICQIRVVKVILCDVSRMALLSHSPSIGILNNIYAVASLTELPPGIESDGEEQYRGPPSTAIAV
jgi:hypothetical protein